MNVMKIHNAAMSLGDRVLTAAYDHCIDGNKLAARHVGEMIATYLPNDLPLQVTGGYRFYQRQRETVDLDLVAIRRVSNREMQNHFKTLAPFFSGQGIAIHTLSEEPVTVDKGAVHPFDRWQVEATCGTIPVVMSLDLTWNNDRYHPFSVNHIDRPVGVNRPSLIKGCRPFQALLQGEATAAAERLLFIIRQPSDDLRCKYMSDAVNGYLWSDGLNCRDVAMALKFTLANRGIDRSEVEEFPDSIAWASLSRLEPDWETSRNAQNSGLDFAEAYCDLNVLWANVHAELMLEYDREFRRSQSRPSIVHRPPEMSVQAFKF